MEKPRVDLTPMKPLSVEDQELFDRVWRRVMPNTERSPIGLGPAQPPRSIERSPAPNSQPKPVVREAPPAAPLEPQPPRVLAPIAEPEYDVPSLGKSSMEYAPLLREMMEGAHGGASAYQALSRRAQGQTARQLVALSADLQRCLRRLGAVYFLLTGRRFQHTARTTIPAGALDGALREMFAREQRWTQACNRAAGDCHDPCLNPLFRELSDGAGARMDGIRRILER